MKTKLQKQHKSIDKGFLALVLFFVCLGIVIIADASAPLAAKDFDDKFYFAKQQLVPAGIGIAGMLIASKISYKFWDKIAIFLFFANLFLMLMVFVPGIGIKLHGASRWVNIGFTALQPSEFLKLTLCIYLAKVASKKMRTLAYLVPMTLSIILVMLQPDLGTTIVLSALGMIQIFIAEINMIPILATSALGIGVGSILILTSDYRKARLEAYLAQTTNPLEGSYHIKQILLALGSGGLFGVGLGQSRQKYLFLPETATDSIFAIVAEEVGFVGSLIIILLFAFLIYKGFKIISTAPDIFSKVLAAGIVSWIGIQVFLNIGSMVSIIPLTGVPLPFISSGGSSLISILIGCGILLNISQNETKLESGKRG